MGTWPGRVIKGKRMAGQMGNARVTQQNVEVIAVDIDEHLMMVKGAVPGANSGEILVMAGLKKTRVAEKKVEATHKVNPLKASKRAAAGRG
jgi:ribosomal protein L3